LIDLVFDLMSCPKENVNKFILDEKLLGEI